MSLARFPACRSRAFRCTASVPVPALVAHPLLLCPQLLPEAVVHHVGVPGAAGSVHGGAVDVQCQ